MSTSALSKYVSSNYQSVNDRDLYYIDAYHAASYFLRENSNIIRMRADKGNITVAVDRDDYFKKIEDMLNDNDTYCIMDRNPIKKLEESLNKKINFWQSKDYITRNLAYSLKSSDRHIPKAYGLPKVHKPGYPYRIIVSSVGSPLHKFAAFLHNVILRSIPRASGNLENSLDLIKKLNFKHMDDSFTIISLDVVSLFTNVPVDLVLKSVSRRWRFININTTIPKEEFLVAIDFVLSSTFFTFNNVFYKQVFGTPMGSPLSPIAADIVLQDLENIFEKA